MSKNSKAYREAAAKVDRDKLYTPMEAAKLAKETEARLVVGMQGFCCASSAYLNALQYARQRIQGRHLLKMRDEINGRSEVKAIFYRPNSF